MKYSDGEKNDDHLYRKVHPWMRFCWYKWWLFDNKWFHKKSVFGHVRPPDLMHPAGTAVISAKNDEVSNFCLKF